MGRRRLATRRNARAFSLSHDVLCFQENVRLWEKVGVRAAGSRISGGLICALMLLAAPDPMAIAQQDGPAAASAPATTTTEPTNLPLEVAVAAPQDEKVDTERRRKLRLAILTGGLIGVTGLSLVIFTILGGSATRRGLRRKPLREGPPELEPIPAERFDEREGNSPEDSSPAKSEDHPAQDGGAR
jgi:hypothetical protein